MFREPVFSGIRSLEELRKYPLGRYKSKDIKSLRKGMSRRKRAIIKNFRFFEQDDLLEDSESESAGSDALASDDEQLIHIGRRIIGLAFDKQKLYPRPRREGAKPAAVSRGKEDRAQPSKKNAIESTPVQPQKANTALPTTSSKFPPSPPNVTKVPAASTKGPTALSPQILRSSTATCKIGYDWSTFWPSFTAHSIIRTDVSSLVPTALTSLTMALQRNKLCVCKVGSSIAAANQEDGYPEGSATAVEGALAKASHIGRRLRFLNSFPCFDPLRGELSETHIRSLEHWADIILPVILDSDAAIESDTSDIGISSHPSAQYSLDFDKKHLHEYFDLDDIETRIRADKQDAFIITPSRGSCRWIEYNSAVDDGFASLVLTAYVFVWQHDLLVRLLQVTGRVVARYNRTHGSVNSNPKSYCTIRTTLPPEILVLPELVFVFADTTLTAIRVSDTSKKGRNPKEEKQIGIYISPSASTHFGINVARAIETACNLATFRSQQLASAIKYSSGSTALQIIERSLLCHVRHLLPLAYLVLHQSSFEKLRNTLIKIAMAVMGFSIQLQTDVADASSVLVQSRSPAQRIFASLVLSTFTGLCEPYDVARVAWNNMVLKYGRRAGGSLSNFWQSQGISSPIPVTELFMLEQFYELVRSSGTVHQDKKSTRPTIEAHQAALGTPDPVPHRNGSLVIPSSAYDVHDPVCRQHHTIIPSGGISIYKADIDSNLPGILQDSIVPDYVEFFIKEAEAFPTSSALPSDGPPVLDERQALQLAKALKAARVDALREKWANCPATKYFEAAVDGSHTPAVGAASGKPPAPSTAAAVVVLSTDGNIERIAIKVYDPRLTHSDAKGHGGASLRCKVSALRAEKISRSLGFQELLALNNSKKQEEGRKRIICNILQDCKAADSGEPSIKDRSKLKLIVDSSEKVVNIPKDTSHTTLFNAGLGKIEARRLADQIAHAFRHSSDVFISVNRDTFEQIVLLRDDLEEGSSTAFESRRHQTECEWRVLQKLYAQKHTFVGETYYGGHFRGDTLVLEHLQKACSAVDVDAHLPSRSTFLDRHRPKQQIALQAALLTDRVDRRSRYHNRDEIDQTLLRFATPDDVITSIKEDIVQTTSQSVITGSWVDRFPCWEEGLFHEAHPHSIADNAADLIQKIAAAHPAASAAFMEDTFRRESICPPSIVIAITIRTGASSIDAAELLAKARPPPSPLSSPLTIRQFPKGLSAFGVQRHLFDMTIYGQTHPAPVCSRCAAPAGAPAADGGGARTADLQHIAGCGHDLVEKNKKLKIWKEGDFLDMLQSMSEHFSKTEGVSTFEIRKSVRYLQDVAGNKVDNVVKTHFSEDHRLGDDQQGTLANEDQEKQRAPGEYEDHAVRRGASVANEVQARSPANVDPTRPSATGDQSVSIRDRNEVAAGSSANEDLTPLPGLRADEDLAPRRETGSGAATEDQAGLSAYKDQAGSSAIEGQTTRTKRSDEDQAGSPVNKGERASEEAIIEDEPALKRQKR